MSELRSECTKREFEKILPGFTQAPASPQKVCDDNERKKQRTKQHACKNVIDGKKLFIRRLRRTGENDLNELRVNYSLDTTKVLFV